MLARIRCITLSACAAILGVVVGWGIAVVYFDRAYHTPAAQVHYAAEASRAKYGVWLLELARSGDMTLLTKALEFELDSTLTTLDFFQQQDPAKFRKGEIEKYIARVREYRKKYPSPDAGPETAAAVGRVLSQSERGSAP